LTPLMRAILAWRLGATRGSASPMLGFALAVRVPSRPPVRAVGPRCSALCGDAVRADGCSFPAAAGRGRVLSSLPRGDERQLSCPDAASAVEGQRDCLFHVCRHSACCVSAYATRRGFGRRSWRGRGAVRTGDVGELTVAYRRRRRSASGCPVWSGVAVEETDCRQGFGPDDGWLRGVRRGLVLRRGVGERSVHALRASVRQVGWALVIEHTMGEDLRVVVRCVSHTVAPTERLHVGLAGSTAEAERAGCCGHTL